MEIIRAALRADDTVPPDAVATILANLEGEQVLPDDGPLLLTMTKAAKKIGMGRTWFWRKVKEDQGRDRKLFPPVEVNPGEYRYRRRDLEAYLARTSTYMPTTSRKQKVKANGS